MKKTTVLIILVFITFSSIGQVTENQKMIELGKAYYDFMFQNEPTKDVLKELI
jgi:hypothetical protein